MKRLSQVKARGGTMDVRIGPITTPQSLKIAKSPSQVVGSPWRSHLVYCQNTLTSAKVSSRALGKLRNSNACPSEKLVLAFSSVGIVSQVIAAFLPFWQKPLRCLSLVTFDNL